MPPSVLYRQLEPAGKNLRSGANTIGGSIIKTTGALIEHEHEQEHEEEQEHEQASINQNPVSSI